MDEKQKNIIDVGRECFNIKGLQATSIDEIVKKCKISKATFYKYFSTKEDLANEILLYSNKKFLNNAKKIDDDSKINNKEKLKMKIILIWEYLLYDSKLNIEIIEKFSECKGEEPISKFKNIRKNKILDEYYKSLEAVYGKDIDKVIWELIFLIDSLVHEFILIMRLKDEKFEADFVGEYVIRVIDINIEKLKDKEPMIKKTDIYFLVDDVENKLYSAEKALFLEKIKNLKEIIKKDDNLINQKKLIEAVNKLQEEAKTESYNSLMMDALLAFLEKEKSLKEEVSILNNLKNKLGDEI
ncbi:transcriptional regulator, TetR family [Clostridium cavendishii DSM 21758]|uniref:Transcriptional regulator, TetR family n=1 Tax=Clostridium cavendishii DSM 21758 TaxID=1121302 RepID=A0A1M6F8G4_9CLOT|nr:TetR/AcrR family transcriptional regulator [Clostridium cavendishii]SHI93952.1 transcriptional regulator, TetR family [Clostridium cavendishii DSM 21758]